jgi:hypothetical protein
LRAVGVHCAYGIGLQSTTSQQTLPIRAVCCAALQSLSAPLRQAARSTVRNTGHRPSRDAAATVIRELGLAADLAHVGRRRRALPRASQTIWCPGDTDTVGGAARGRRAVNPLLRRSASWEPVHRNDRRESQARVRTPSVPLCWSGLRVSSIQRRDGYDGRRIATHSASACALTSVYSHHKCVDVHLTTSVAAVAGCT